jgi:hypothetical protein
MTDGRCGGGTAATLLVLFHLAVALMPPAAVAQDGPLRVFQLDPQVLVETRRAVAAGNRALTGAVRRLQKDAEKAMRQEVGSVMQKSVAAPGGDMHDYVSLARYFWPDPSTADGLPYVRRDGEVNPESDTAGDATRMETMIRSTGTLALAWFYTGNEEYASRAAEHLRTWFLDPATRMNPNLNYGQIVRGKNVGRGSGLIDVREFSGLVDAVGLLAGSPSWTTADELALRAWFGEYLDWLQTSPVARQEAAAGNNHGVWFDVQRVSIALFVGRTELARTILEDAKAARIAAQIAPDGSQPRELDRTRSMHYTAFNLRAFAALALLGDRTGVDLWRYSTADGRSIRRALDWFLPYYTGEKAWEHPQIDTYKKETFAPVLFRSAIIYADSRYRDAGVTALGEKAATDRTLLLFGLP